jgi:hypothetical protein
MRSGRELRVWALVFTTALISCGQSGIHVSRAEFGDAWPFTVSEGTLRCDTDGPRKYITLDTGNGIHYGINGSARSFGFPDVASIQKAGTVGVDLQPFIERGLTLCR